MSTDEEAPQPVARPAGYTPPAQTEPKPKKKRKALTRVTPDGEPDGIALMPGTHILPTGEIVEVSGADFADAAIKRLVSFGAIYRRGPIVGTVEEGEFRVLEATHARVYFDRFAPRPQYWKTVAGEQERLYEPYSTNLAELVLAAASTHLDVPEIDMVVRGPTYRINSQGLMPIAFGYDAKSRTYSTWDWIQEGPEMDPLDLIEDFPFQTSADKATFIALIITILLRPHLRCNVPMFLIGASGPGSGKTMLCETVLGELLLGKRVAALQIGQDEAERDKRFSSILLRGDQIVLLDNLPHRLDSAALAAATTAENYLARWLGMNRMFEVRNCAVWCLTANNLQLTEELARRTLPVRLEPHQDRKSFRFPDLGGHIRANRDAYVRGAIRWLVRWQQAGMPMSSQTIPSFEQWSRIIGGIMEANGWGEAWLANRRSFMDSADSDIGDLRKLLGLWHEHMPRMSTRDIKIICENHGLFPTAMDKASERGQLTALGRNLLRYKGRVFDGWKLVVEGTGSERWYVRQRAT